MAKPPHQVPDELSNLMLQVCTTCDGVEKYQEFMTLAEFCNQYIVSKIAFNNITSPYADVLEQVTLVPIYVLDAYNQLDEQEKEDLDNFIQGTCKPERVGRMDLDQFSANIYIVRSPKS